MLPEPLHPAVVHFPIVFGVVLPIVAIVVLLLIRRGAPARTSWLWVVLVSAALAGSAWLAVETGEEQEEAVERVVAESAIHDHEEAAESFFRLSVIALLVITAGLAGGRVGAGARYASAALALGLVVAGYRVGGSGGELVYEHGAAAAYVVPPDGSTAVAQPAGKAGELGREREERGERDGHR